MQLTSVQTQSWGILKDTVVDFEPGLTAFIGETGSGKSMIMHAVLYGLGFIKGDKKWVAEKAQFAEITLNLLTKHGLPEWLGSCEDNMVQIQRRLHISGRHKITCQGQLITVAQLKALTQNHFVASTQHSLLQIKDKKQMLAFVDSWLEPEHLIKAQTAYDHVNTIKQKIKHAKSAQLPAYELSQLKQSSDEMSAVFRELADNSFKEIEDAQAKKASLKENQHHIDMCLKIIQQDNGLTDNARSLRKSLSYINDNDLSIQQEQLEASINAIGDICFQKQHTDIETEDYSELINKVNRLCKKHHCLPEHIEELHAENTKRIDNHLTSTDLLPCLEQDLANAIMHYHKESKQITQLRQKVCTDINNKYQNHLPSLGMQHADVRWSINADETVIAATGHDHICIDFKANAGSDYHPIEAIASGGELSRLFLILQIIKPKEQSQTYIFDEIDTGISGDVAEKVGHLIHELARQQNILMISHLPQVACYADHIIYIDKQVVSGKTQSDICTMAKDNHRIALAKLMSSPDHSTTLSHIDNLLDKALQQKEKAH